MHFLHITDCDAHQIMDIFHLADNLKDGQYRPALSGKTVVMFFPESSIRTRITFEKALHTLGGSPVLFDPSTLDTREAVQDVMGYLENWVDVVVVRHKEIEKLREMAEYTSLPLINAMTSHNHPCEILSDLYALSRMRPDYRELVYTFVGEQGNISRSWAAIAHVFNLRLHHVCCAGNRLQPDSPNYTFSTQLEEVLPHSDVILTDPLSEPYRHADYYQQYQITRARMASCKPGALLNPCPPFSRGQEVSSDVIESPYFVGYQFKESLVWVQQAILLYCVQNP